MGAQTSIEWTDATWNPVRGCSMAKGSEAGGCLNCYAARTAARFSDGPFEGFARITGSGPRWTGKVELVAKHLEEPLKWREPKRIFVNSMSDLFHEGLPDEAIDRVFDVMALCPKHIFQVLTKRPERMLGYCVKRARSMADIRSGECSSLHGAFPDFLPNVWLGVSVENQATAGVRIPLLLQTPAAKRFVSYEPALGPVDLSEFMWPVCWSWSAKYRTPEEALANGAYAELKPQGLVSAAARFLDWVIVGGESGPGARPFDISWARKTVAQCSVSRVPCFVKQLGARPIWPLVGGLGRWADHVRFERETSREAPYHWDKIRLRDRKGGDWSEWPEDLRVRQFPEPSCK